MSNRSNYRTRLARDIDVVDVHADGRISREERLCFADATHEDLRGTARAGVRRDVEVGDDLPELGNAANLLPLEHIFGQRGDRHRHGLLDLGAALRRDRDLFENRKYAAGPLLARLFLCESGGACMTQTASGQCNCRDGRAAHADEPRRKGAP